MIFGLASLAAAFAPDMMTLNILRYGSGPRCRNRGRLFHHDRVRAAADARSLARLYVVYRGVRAAGNRATWLLDHPELRLAADVRDLRPRLARCLVSPQIATGVAALARDARPDCGSRGAALQQSKATAPLLRPVLDVPDFMLPSRQSPVLYRPVGPPRVPWDLPQSSVAGS